MERRYQVHDEIGLLRAFYSRAEALHFIGNDVSLFLVVVPRKKRVKIDLSNEPPALW